MATIGLDKLFYAPITEEENGDETYGSPVMLAKAMTAELSIELGVDDIGVAAARALTGAQVDDNGVLISASENDGSPVAVGFRACKANGAYRYFWLYRVKFAVPATNLATKGDSITFSTPTIEGTVMRRNKLDGKGQHPWKAEVNEDDTSVAAATISGWYNAVYEPVFEPAPEPGA